MTPEEIVELAEQTNAIDAAYQAGQMHKRDYKKFCAWRAEIVARMTDDERNALFNLCT